MIPVAGPWMIEKETASRPFFSPLSSLRAYEGASDAARAQRENVVAYDICARGINLPCGANLTKETAQEVAHALCS